MRVLALPLVFLTLALVPHAGAASRTIDIEAGTNPDGTMYLKPSNITVNLGDEVTLRVHNPDRIFHDVALLRYAGEDLEIEVPAGKTESHTFLAAQAGEFRLVCEGTGHKQKGMFGYLHVVDPKESPDMGAVGALAALLVGVALVARRMA